MKELRMDEKNAVDINELRLDIDQNDMLNEWRGQASMMLRYGMLLADAQMAEDHARASLDVARATTEQDVRSHPRRYGIEKVTEAVVTAAVSTSDVCREAEARRIEAAHEVRMLRAVVDALAHRKSALSGITDLFLKQWHADPSSGSHPQELRDAAKSTKKVIPGRKVRRPVS